jgi:hypothetical protein
MRASACKRGRNPRFPYIAIVIRDNGTTHNTNARLAYATRAEAIEGAQAWIDYAIKHAASVEAARIKRQGN